MPYIRMLGMWIVVYFMGLLQSPQSLQEHSWAES